MNRKYGLWVALGALVLIVAAGFTASPVAQPQQVSDLVDRVTALETAVAQQQDLNDNLVKRVEVLEAKVGITPTVAAPEPPITIPNDWQPHISSDGVISYMFSPQWTLQSDEPGNIGFEIDETAQWLYFGWNYRADLLDKLRTDKAFFKTFEQGLLSGTEENSAKSKLVSSGEKTINKIPALYWEVTITDSNGFGIRELLVYYSCSPNASCGLALAQMGKNRTFTDADWALLSAFARPIKFLGVGKSTVNANANLRSCASIHCKIVGNALQGQIIELVAQSADGNWYQLKTGEWIAASLVDNAPKNLPVIKEPINSQGAIQVVPVHFESLCTRVAALA